MTAPSRLILVVTFAAAILISSCRQGNGPQTLINAVRRAEQVLLLEGLPHQHFERVLLEEDRRTKAVQELNGYFFYQEPLGLTEKDGTNLSELLGDSETYKPFSGEKKCGGFHPDYAVEWHVGIDRYRALICFGCGEVKLFGPGLESRNDVNKVANEKLKEILKNYRKNRPAVKDLD